MDKKTIEILNKCASVMLPLNYYSFFEQWADGQFKESIGTDELIKQTALAITGDDVDILNLRKEIIARTEEIMYFLDKYALFEHVLARIQGKYVQTDASSTDIKAEIDKLILDLSQTKDKNIVHTNILCIMSQLPVRMTKQKFFDIVAGNLKIYTGLNKRSAEDFYNNMLSYAGIKPDNLKDKESFYPELEKIASRLEKTDFAALGADEFRLIEEEYNKAYDKITETISCLEGLVKTVNQLIVLDKTKEHEPAEAAEIRQHMKPMYENVSKALLDNTPEEYDEDMADIFETLEGKAERYLNDKMRLEGKIDEKNQSAEENILFMLLSDSSFADIDEVYNYNQETASADYIMELTQNFSDSFTEAIKDDYKNMTRARMAAVLGQMLPLFDNINDFKTYIEGTLGNCRDEAERIGSLNQIKSLLS